MLNTFLFYYYLIHIPITILIDASVIIPTKYHTTLTTHLLQFHISQNNDILLLHPQTWFKAFIAIECVVQLPLFFYFVTKHLRSKLDVRYYLWSVIYGFNASFTTLVCLVYISIDGRVVYGLSGVEVVKLWGIYLPYLIIPSIILINGFNQIVEQNDTVKEKA